MTGSRDGGGPPRDLQLRERYRLSLCSTRRTQAWDRKVPGTERSSELGQMSVCGNSRDKRLRVSKQGHIRGAVRGWDTWALCEERALSTGEPWTSPE